MKRIGTALICCGKVGHTHARALAALDESRFEAVYHPSLEKAAAFAGTYGVQPYSDLAAMLARPGLGMVTICTPHLSHPELAVACAQARLHVLVEKPMAVDLRGCDRMIQAAEAAGVQLGVVSQRRFYEPVRRVRQAILDGKIGKPVLGTVTVLGWRDEAYYRSDPWRGRWATEGGGVMLTQTTHQIDLFQWLMGPIDELFG